MAKLNQILALEKGAKTHAYNELTTAHNRALKPALISGISRTYKPKDDDGDQLPPESTKVQVTVGQVLKTVADSHARLFDLIGTKDDANCNARADVILDGEVLLGNCPVTYLLFLEKQLTDFRTFIAKLPVLDPAEAWRWDSTADCWATEPSGTTRTKKIPRNHVKAEATEHHPAQVEVYTEDAIVGTWNTIKFSGAVPQAEVNSMLARAEKLLVAVKVAREEANSIQVADFKSGSTVFGYLFGGELAAPIDPPAKSGRIK